jgi:hypothetical protein
MVREGVGIGCGDWRDVVFVPVYYGDDFVRSFLERLGHGATYFQDICTTESVYSSATQRHRPQRTSLSSRLRKRDVQRPLLPANVLLCAAKKVGLFSLLLKELHYELSSSPLLVCAIYSPYESQRSLLNERLQVYIVDGGKGEVEQVACEGRYGSEVSVEEYGMQYCCSKAQLWSRGDFGRGEVRSGGGQVELKDKCRQQKTDVPFTTSFTHARSAKMSILYSGRRRGSMVTCACSHPKPWLQKDPAARRAASLLGCVATRRWRCDGSSCFGGLAICSPCSGCCGLVWCGGGMQRVARSSFLRQWLWRGTFADEGPTQPRCR